MKIIMSQKYLYSSNFISLLLEKAESTFVKLVFLYIKYLILINLKHKLQIKLLALFAIQIREETQTKIDLPAEGEKSDVITITGKKENVEKARDMIQKIQNELVMFILELNKNTFLSVSRERK